MRRREFIALLGTATFPVRAQQTTMQVIGFLHSASAEPNANLVKAFNAISISHGTLSAIRSAGVTFSRPRHILT